MISELLQSIGILPSQEKIAYSQIPLETLKSMTVWERIQANDWTLEIVTVSFTVGFVVLFLIGDYYNEYLVKTFLQNITSVFTSNFAQWGVNNNQLYIKDSSEAYSSYATGRENIAKVDLTFKLKPRYNTFVWILESLLSYFTESVAPPSDRVDIVITPSKEFDNFITAIVTKMGMNDLRKFNYFLSLTKTTESAKLPETFVFMSEASEFYDKTFNTGLNKVLTPQDASFIRFIAITDQGIEKPETIAECAPKKKILVSVKLTSNKDQLSQLSKILDSVFSIVDELSEGQIKFESLKKVVQTREKEISKLKKLQAEIEAERLADQKAEQLRKEKEAIRKLPLAEQEKLERKALEKKQRKAMKKQKLRM